MEDMHIHLRKAIFDQNLFDKYIQKCIEKKLDRVVFLDHANRISAKHNPVLSTKDTIDEFNKKILAFKNSNFSKTLKVIRGIEIDYSKNVDFRNETFKILNYGNFEWIVGAIHSMKFEDLGQYLKAIIDMLNNYTINVIAHLKMNDDYHKYDELFIEIFRICHIKNVSIEINTSDRSRWNDEQLYYMLNLMKEYKVKYVISSDSHRLEEIGYMVEDTIKKVKEWEKHYGKK